MFDRTNPRHLAAIKTSLSASRLGSYEATAGSPAGGLQLYEWNASASAALYCTLQTVEVVVRNALHQQLVMLHQRSGKPGSWLDDPYGILEARCTRDIAEARQRVRQAGYKDSPERVITELSFGFWRFLLSGRYHNMLWVPALRHAFKELRPQRRREVYEPIERLHRLRNRIAHHEPIHGRNLAMDHADALWILSAVCPITHSWAQLTSTVPAVLTVRPPIPRQPRPR